MREEKKGVTRRMYAAKRRVSERVERVDHALIIRL
jgi:hypothetical protein